MSEESSILFLVDEHDAAIRAHWILSLAPPSTAISRTVHHDSSTAATIGTVATNENSSTSTANQPAAAYDRWTVLDDSTINYGYFAKTGGKVDTPNNDDTTKGFYLTTAINYTNGPAHMGHAYEAATADTIARFARLKGEPGGVYFVTGADEHGQKIANTAAAEGKEPIEICDKVNTRQSRGKFWLRVVQIVALLIFCFVALVWQYVIGFRCLNQRLRISNDDYIRTTSERHKRTARALWKKCHENGDVYLDNYSGWYNIREETFVTESDAKKSDYKDPSSGLPLKEVQEASYFFRMSKYQQRLIQYLEDHPGFIRPEQQRNSILVRLRNDELRDLSISRTTFTWGISVPEGFDPQHVMYVWVDALSNYLTGVDALEVEQEQDGVPKLTSFWPADIHIIGKDILWFHAVIWPCLLMSANLPIQKMVFAHGFVNDKEGIKMSKSLGNVVDPHDMLDKFPVDSFRW
jgi:methionyl-tRNA synthetase